LYLLDAEFRYNKDELPGAIAKVVEIAARIITVIVFVLLIVARTMGVRAPSP
jgi:hypothetical protein